MSARNREVSLSGSIRKKLTSTDARWMFAAARLWTSAQFKDGFVNASGGRDMSDKPRFCSPITAHKQEKKEYLYQATNIIFR